MPRTPSNALEFWSKSVAAPIEAVAELGVERVVLFGSGARDQTGLARDLDLLIVWETDLSFLERTVAL